MADDSPAVVEFDTSFDPALRFSEALRLLLVRLMVHYLILFVEQFNHDFDKIRKI